MVVGGLLLTVLTLGNTVSIFVIFTTVSALVAIRYPPELKEQTRTPVRKMWRTVDKKSKTLGLGFGLLNGALDAWGVVILPVYFPTGLGLSSAFVGTVIMGEYIFQGVIITLFSKYVNIPGDSRTSLIVSGLVLIPVSLSLSVPMSLYPFLALVFVYLFFFSVSMVFYNHLRLDFASQERTSLDLAAFTTLSNVFKPLAVLASGFLAESLGSSWAYYFTSLLTLFSALTCLGLPKSTAQPADLVGSYAEGSVTLK